ncbi:MAG: hypothetical protein DRN66_01125 [Candidatus Nanohalarchaeota archaeon]|nr:MAG: hypothetical protein DRN66_01125 [Candidatus Nanohaloarchaeota archaeon]
MVFELISKKLEEPPRVLKHNIIDLIFKRNGYIIYWDLMMITLSACTSFFVFHFMTFGQGLIFSAIIFAISLRIPAEYVKNALNDAYLYKKGIETEGIITEKKEMGRLWKKCYLCYRFSDKNNNVYTSKLWLIYPINMARNLNKDTYVTVLYDNKNPRKNTVCEVAGFLEKKDNTYNEYLNKYRNY